MILYNEWENYNANWLINLVNAGMLPMGYVDDRDIRQITGSCIRKYRDCHFFAGIGGWPLALQLANWPANRQVWSGSCPCQPFSLAGNKQGVKDERHLWPEFCRLIAECKPTTIFGEQVANKAGREWLAGVRVDLEALEYAVGAADLCAAGVGAPHIRQRLYWVASRMGNSVRSRLHERKCDRRIQRRTLRKQKRKTFKLPSYSLSETSPLSFTDESARRIESGTYPMVVGFPGRVGRIRAYGNAIVPQLAAVFIKAFLSAERT